MGDPEGRKPLQQTSLEEEDLFEDFADQEEGEEQQDPTKLPLWEADWDDEDVGEDFGIKLKEELGKAAPASTQSSEAQPMQAGE